MRRLKTFPHRLPTRIAYLESRGGKISRGDRDKDVNDPFVGANYEPTRVHRGEQGDSFTPWIAIEIRGILGGSVKG